MSDYPKYRLKKDTPMDKAGTIFELHDDCEHEWLASDECKTQYQINRVDNFDEWFEEAKEPEWVRKQIKRVDITALNKSGESGYKYTDVQYRFIKPFYYDDAECGVDVYAKNSTSYQRFYMDDKPDELGYLNQVAFINQLIRDGYIEIEDNPNIVWEDEKCD